ncbi:MAG: hypothetical protein ACRCXA_05960 [Peptostreptococcaceae bacterium]
MSYIAPNSKFEVFVKNIGIKQKFDKLITKSVNLTPQQIQMAMEFANKSVEESTDYLLLVPKEIKDKELQKEIGRQRIFVEKISECGFLNYLVSQNKDISLIEKNKIGIKTAIAKEIHTRITIDKNEFLNKKAKKNYYVGVHLNLEMEDKKDKVKRHFIKDLYEIERVQIFGYLDYKFLNELKYETVKNKEGKKEFKFYNKKANGYESKSDFANILDTQCKWYYLNRMLPIESLVKNLK